jgi:ABC-type ATPase involved in cell division
MVLKYLRAELEMYHKGRVFEDHYLHLRTNSLKFRLVRIYHKGSQKHFPVRLLAFENGVLAFENGVLAFEKGVLAFEKGVLAFEKGVLAFENGDLINRQANKIDPGGHKVGHVFQDYNLH